MLITDAQGETFKKVGLCCPILVETSFLMDSYFSQAISVIDLMATLKRFFFL